MRTWREGDPKGADGVDALLTRTMEIRQKLEHVPVGTFLAIEVGPLMRVLGLQGNKEPSPEDFAIIENRLAQLK